MTSTDTPRVSPFGDGGPSRSRPGWLIPVAVFGGILALIALMFVTTNNGLVDKEENVDRQFANLDTALQRRYDLIPQLSETVRAALRQEQAVFGEIARARTQYGGASGVGEKAEAAGQLEGALSRLLVIVEQYPQLQSNQTIQNFQVQLEGTENRIAQERRDYNELATEYNKAIRKFPRSLFAGMLGFDKKDLFEAKVGASEPPPVDLNVTPSTPLPSSPS